MKWRLEQASQLSSVRRVTERKLGGRTGIDSVPGKTLPILLRSRRAHTSDWVLPHRYPDGSCVCGVLRCRTPTNCSVGCRCQPEHTDGEPNISTRQTRLVWSPFAKAHLSGVLRRSCVSLESDRKCWCHGHADTHSGYVNKFTAPRKSCQDGTECRGGVLEVLKGRYCFSPPKYQGVNGAKAGCDSVQTTPPFRTFRLLSASTRRCVSC